MIGTLVKLYRARRDPAQITQLVTEFGTDAALARISWPVTLAKFWLGLGLMALTILIGLSLWAAFSWHAAWVIPALPGGTLAYAIIRLWRGFDRVVARVKAEIARRLTLKTD